MKKILFLFLLSVSLTWFAATSDWTGSANLIASKWLITDYSASPEKYRLSDTITRKESIKIIVKLAGGNPGETCEGKFKDISKNDWSCKYVEWALTKWLIASTSTFRPDDNITRAEVLKLIFKAKWLTKSYNTTNWQSDYYKSALDMGLIDASQDDAMYNANALRGWIFYTVSKTYENPIEQQKVISNEAL